MPDHQSPLFFKQQTEKMLKSIQGTLVWHNLTFLEVLRTLEEQNEAILKLQEEVKELKGEKRNLLDHLLAIDQNP